LPWVVVKMALISAPPLDGGMMVAVRNDHWCCLLCLRQFKSEQQLAKHVSRSTLHADNLATAIAQGRVPSTAGASKADDAPADRRERERPPKRAAPDGDVGADEGVGEGAVANSAGGNGGIGGGKSGSLSALEQMELFEKRLKVEARRAPEKPAVASSMDEVQVDSNHARTINRQMDWECGGCGAFNFARVVVCIECKKYVDSNTKYVSNRLKDLKQQRFASLLQSDERAEYAPQQRADGSCGDGNPNSRATFHQ